MKLILVDYMKIAIWWRELFWCRKWAIFCCSAGFFPHLQGFRQRFGWRGKIVSNKSWSWNGKCVPQAKFLVKFVWKELKILFSICGLQSREGQNEIWKEGEGLHFLVRSDIEQKDEFQNFGHEWGEPSSIPSLVANPDPHITNTFRSVVGLTIVIILKRVSKSIFLQSNKFTACTVRDKKEVKKSLMVFNTCKIIYPIQSKRYLRT